MINFSIIFLLILILILIVTLIRQNNGLVKILQVNIITSLAALVICLFGIAPENNSLLDLALIYFLFSFIATQSYLKFFLTTQK